MDYRYNFVAKLSNYFSSKFDMNDETIAFLASDPLYTLERSANGRTRSKLRVPNMETLPPFPSYVCNTYPPMISEHDFREESIAFDHMSNAYLSNTYRFDFEHDGIWFNSVEQFYKYHKYLVIDPWFAKLILVMPDPETIKKATRKHNYIEFRHQSRKATPRPVGKAHIKSEYERLRTEFALTKYFVMRAGIYLKFMCGDKLRRELIATDGMYLQHRCDKFDDNLVGRILMEIRDNILFDCQ